MVRLSRDKNGKIRVAKGDQSGLGGQYAPDPKKLDAAKKKIKELNGISKRNEYLKNKELLGKASPNSDGKYIVDKQGRVIDFNPWRNQYLIKDNLKILLENNIAADFAVYDEGKVKGLLNYLKSYFARKTTSKTDSLYESSYVISDIPPADKYFKKRNIKKQWSGQDGTIAVLKIRKDSLVEVSLPPGFQKYPTSNNDGKNIIFVAASESSTSGEYEKITLVESKITNPTNNNDVTGRLRFGPTFVFDLGKKSNEKSDEHAEEIMKIIYNAAEYKKSAEWEAIRNSL